MIARKKPPRRTRWNHDKVVRAIHQRQKRGLPLNLDAVKRTESPLAYGAALCFDNWSDALRAAGFDPAEIRYNPKWSKRKVIRAILSRAAKGLSLRHAVVRQEDSSLMSAASAYFRNWGAALRAAGIDPDACRAFRTWTESEIVRAIRRDARAGLPINSFAVQHRETKLVSAAERHFGSWDAMLRAAGFDPRQHRLHRPPLAREDVIQLIRQRHADGESVNSSAMRSGCVVNTGIRLFGSWDNALRAAGLEPQAVRKANPYYKAEEIVEAIRARAAKGEPLNASATREAEPRLYRSARAVFGSWTEALDEAGLDGSRIGRKKTKWTRLTIVERLLWRREKELPINMATIIREISFPAIKREFGSYPDALRAAGIDPDTVYLAKRWSRQMILDGIQSRKKAGKPLNANALHEDDPRLLGAARRHFGKWDAALIEAGVDPTEYRGKRPRWTRKQVLSGLRSRMQDGQRLSAQRVRPYSLYKASVRLFGSWHAAVDEAIQGMQDK